MVAPFFPSVHYATSSHWYPSFHSLISLHIRSMSDPRLDIKTAPHFLRFPLVEQLYVKGVHFCSFVTKCNQACTKYSNAFNSFYRTITHVHDFSRPRIRLSTPPQHQTIKALQTAERTKLGLLSLPSMWFLTKSWHTPCPTGKRSRTSAGKLYCANNNKVTNPREVILSYKILYRILNSWNAILLTFTFLEQCNIILSLNSITIL